MKVRWPRFEIHEFFEKFENFENFEKKFELKKILRGLKIGRTASKKQDPALQIKKEKNRTYDIVHIKKKKIFFSKTSRIPWWSDVVSFLFKKIFKIFVFASENFLASVVADEKNKKKLWLNSMADIRLKTGPSYLHRW